MRKGMLVKEAKYGMEGMITQVFSSWEDLKAKTRFVTFADDEATEVDRLINGDPEDEWLKRQEKPFTKENLSERWFTIRCFSGGAFWTCESLLSLKNPVLN